MLEAIRIRKAGYAVRIPMFEFVSRYKQIFGKKSGRLFNAEIGVKIQCKSILEAKLDADGGEQMW